MGTGISESYGAGAVRTDILITAEKSGVLVSRDDVKIIPTSALIGNVAVRFFAIGVLVIGSRSGRVEQFGGNDCGARDALRLGCATAAVRESGWH